MCFGAIRTFAPCRAMSTTSWIVMSSPVSVTVLWAFVGSIGSKPSWSWAPAIAGAPSSATPDASKAQRSVRENAISPS